jgi:hypothetical protein
MTGRQWPGFRNTFSAFETRWVAWAMVVPVVLAPAVATAASLLPLVTQEVQTLPNDTAEATFGVAYSGDGRFPGFIDPGTLRHQTVVHAPQLGFNLGVGNWAEFQASYELIYLDEETSSGQTNTQYGGGDARVFTKLHFTNETARLPGVGLWFGTKLPNATRSSLLGTDDTDFGADAVLSKDFGPVAAHANLGILLLGNSGPLIGNSFTAGGQDDLVNYNLAVVSKPLSAIGAGTLPLRLMAEFTGATGSRFGNDRDALRFGLQMVRGPATFYLGVSVGLITASENIGASGGFVYTFEPSTLFEAFKQDTSVK